MTKHKIIILILALFTVLVLFFVIELLYIRSNGTPVAAPEIPRGPQQFGSGEPLKYVVMGDSTTISQGGTYSNGYAVQSAQHLAEKYQVTLVNVGVSGATSATVLRDQLAKAISEKPDIVLIGVGANDATHFTPGGSIQKSIQGIVDGLKTANPKVRIVVTRSAAVDSVSRFPVGARQLMKLRVDQVNEAFESVIVKNSLTLAPVAEKTRQAFLDDPSLLAEDRFHPNDRGYALWIPVINDAIDEAMR